MITKKTYETTEQKMIGYETVAKFYEINYGGRFQNKIGLNRILNEITTELDNPKTEKHFTKLQVLQDRIKKFTQKNLFFL